MKSRTGLAVGIINKSLTNFYTAVTYTVVFLIASSISFATLIVGVTKRSQCPIQTMIPTWLIVFGSVGILFCIVNIFSYVAILCLKPENVRINPVIVSCTLLFVTCPLFLFVWMFVGSAWVFSVKPTVQFTNSYRTDYCDEPLFNLALGVIITEYCLIGILCAYIICKVLFHLKKNQTESQG